MTSDVSPPALLSEIRHLIDAARQRVAVTINAELTVLYWQIGRRIGDEVLRGRRAEYGAEVLKEAGGGADEGVRDRVERTATALLCTRG